MTFKSLARTYRPTKFSELVGQEAMAKALGNAIRLGRAPHGVIFSGVRGIGKTTTARLYAKALNCQLGPTPEPCNECSSCEAIASGRHEDVLEVDGASNNGVAEVRALQETVDYVPQRSSYKVYIVDEVHMLSTAAFNALLKTLEEPPAHVIFVFATTELEKVPQTIHSRCQVFHLRKLSVRTIRDRLVYILEKEQIAFDEKAVAVIAREGHGSMRDAVTLLEQAIAIGEGRVSTDSLSHMVSNLSSTPYLNLLGSLVDRNAPVIIEQLNHLDEQGSSFIDVVEEAATLVRHAFVVRDLGAEALDTTMLAMDDSELEQLKELGERAGDFDLNRIFRTLVQCRRELDGSTIDRFVLENYLLEWCLDPGLPPLDDILATLEGAAGGPRKSSVGNLNGKRQAEGRGPSNWNQAAAKGMGHPSSDQHRPEVPRPEVPRPDALRPEEPRSEEPLPEAPRPEEPRPDISSLSKGKLTSRFKKMQQERTDSVSRDVGGGRSSRGKGHSTLAVSNTESKQLTNEEAAELPPSKTSESIPSTWREFVEIWKKRRPLAARKLEFAHPVHYGADAIHLAIDPKHFAARQLLQVEEQRSLKTEFKELFNFDGEFSVTTKDQATAQVVADDSVEASADPGDEDINEANLDVEVPRAKIHSLPETIIAIRAKERDTHRRQLMEAAVQAPFTQEMLAVFRGAIEDVSMVEE